MKKTKDETTIGRGLLVCVMLVHEDDPFKDTRQNDEGEDAHEDIPDSEIAHPEEEIVPDLDSLVEEEENRIPEIEPPIREWDEEPVPVEEIPDDEDEDVDDFDDVEEADIPIPPREDPTKTGDDV